MTNTKTCENMTVTVTCKENEDLEMRSLIKKLSMAKELRENTEVIYLPKIKAVGCAKWTAIVTQLLGLCKVAEEIGIRSQLGRFMSVNFTRDDDGATCQIRLEWYAPTKTYQLSYGYIGTIYQTAQLSPVEGYCPKSELEDKDGWLAKWDEYDLYNRFRSKLMKEIQRRTDAENAKSNEILDLYSEFAKIGQ